jgi:hypothetical protein
VVTGQGGTVTVFTKNADGTYSRTPNSPAMTNFAQYFARLTQQNHNHNNEIIANDPASRPHSAPFPEWLGLTDNGTNFANGNFELFPLVSAEALAASPNPFEMNIPPVRTVVEAPNDALLFIYEGGEMRAAYYDGVWMSISGLQNSVGAPLPGDDRNEETGITFGFAAVSIAGAALLISVAAKAKRRED